LEFVVRERETEVEAKRRWIGETIGYVSVSWLPMPEGVFDSTRAAQATDGLIEALGLSAGPEVAPEPLFDDTIYGPGPVR
jgi:hypothetical protein